MELVILKEHCLVCGDSLESTSKRSVLDTTGVSDKQIYKFIGKIKLNYVEFFK